MRVTELRPLFSPTEKLKKTKIIFVVGESRTGGSLQALVGAGAGDCALGSAPPSMGDLGRPCPWGGPASQGF